MLVVHLVSLKSLFKMVNDSAVYKSEEPSARDLMCYATLKLILKNNSFLNTVLLT